jgi:hypothetical protein
LSLYENLGCKVNLSKKRFKMEQAVTQVKAIRNRVFGNNPIVLNSVFLIYSKILLSLKKSYTIETNYILQRNIYDKRKSKNLKRAPCGH